VLPGPMLAIDLNGDGKVDLVSGRSLLMGVGDGTFRSAVFLPGVCGAQYGGNPRYCSDQSAAVGDFNGDGLPDLLLGANFLNISPQFAVVYTALNDSPGDGLWVAGISAATGTWPVGGDSIVSAFGANLASQTESATGLPLPTTLGGVQVLLNGVPTQLLYVSPSQINYVGPYGAGQMVSIGVRRVGTNYVTKGISMPVYPVSAGFFMANQAAGIPAATAVRVNADGTQTPLRVFSCSASGCTATPIDVSTGAVYLTLYGTGFSDSALPSPLLSELPQCLLGSTAIVQPTFSGQQPAGTPGLDQMNIPLPKSLSGKGNVKVACYFSPNLYGLIDTATAVNIQVR